MIYLLVKWKHQFTDEPTEIYSELDEYRNETRKIERFADGSAYLVSENSVYGDTMLSERPIPSNEEINIDPQFEAIEIDRDAFESLWSKYIAIHSTRHNKPQERS